MGLIIKLREAWHNFVTGKPSKERMVINQSCEWGSLVFPTTATSEDEKYEFISQACSIMEDEIKIVKHKLKSKNKSK